MFKKFKKNIRFNGVVFGSIFFYRKIKQLILCKLIELQTGWIDIKLEGCFEIRGFKNIKIGKRFYSKDGLWLESIAFYNNNSYDGLISIGNDFSCSRYAHISAAYSITIGNGVLLGSNVLITDNNHGEYSGIDSANPFVPPAQRKLSGCSEIIIGDNVWLGDDVKVLPGSNIGAGSVVAAGSIVKSSIPPNCIAVGRPARAVKFYNPNKKQWSRIDGA